MSWDPYLDNLVAQSKDPEGTQHVDRAVIFGLDGGAPWTTVGHDKALKGTAQELQELAKCFKSKNFSALQANGVRLEGTKYQFLREEDGKVVMAKKKGLGAVTIQSSKTAIVAAHCPEGCQQGTANKAVGVIAEYLESLNM